MSQLHILDRVQKKGPPRPGGFATDSAEESSDVDGRGRAAKTAMREQAVDEILQLKLYETACSDAGAAHSLGGPRPVVVLATGVVLGLDAVHVDVVVLCARHSGSERPTRGFGCAGWSARDGRCSDWAW